MLYLCFSASSTCLLLTRLSSHATYLPYSHLNSLCFFLQRIFSLPTDHYIVLSRLALWCLLTPALTRQIYIYVADPKCRRMGVHALVGHACLVTESLVSFKHGRQSGLFKHKEVVESLQRWVVLMVVCTAASTFLYREYMKRVHTKQP